MLSTAVVVANAIAAAAIESLSDAVKDFPQCSLSAFKKALDKEGCDVKSVGGGTFDCMCKHLESIVVTMSTSGIDANCEASKPLIISLSLYIYLCLCRGMLTNVPPPTRLEQCLNASLRTMGAL